MLNKNTLFKANKNERSDLFWIFRVAEMLFHCVLCLKLITLTCNTFLKDLIVREIFDTRAQKKWIGSKKKHKPNLDNYELYGGRRPTSYF